MRRHIGVLQSPNRVHRRRRRIPGRVPTAELLPTTHSSVEPPTLRQAADQHQQPQRGQRAARMHQIPQIHPVMLEQVSGQMLTVLIYEVGEPSASPAWVPSIHRENTRSVNAKSSSMDSTSFAPSFSLSATKGRIFNAI